MYSRSRRQISEPEGRTAEHVGPGSYAPISPFTVKTSHSTGFAPFGQLTTRETEFAQPKFQTPTPAKYNPSLPSASKGTSVLASRSERFKKADTEAPPPGSYDVALPLKGQMTWATYYATDSPARHPKLAPRVHFERHPTAPAIPGRLENRGFKVDNGQLVQLHAKVKKPEDIGPGSYNIAAADSTATTTKYKGVGWSKRTSQRKLPEMAQASNPSAFEYTVSPMPTSKQSDAQGGWEEAATARVSRPFNTTSARDVIEPHVPSSNGVPAPSSYSLPSEFDGGKRHPQRSFGTTDTRFKDPAALTPGPGSYDDGVKGVTVKASKPFYSAASPFLQSALRFSAEHEEKHPEPGTYNIPDSFSHKSASLGAPGFSSTSRRTDPIYKKDASSFPAPGQHQPQFDAIGVTVKAPIPHDQSPAFSSRTERFTDTVSDAPPATHYNLSSAASKRGQVPSSSAFKSTSKRVLELGSTEVTPDPAAYNTAGGPSKRGGLITDKTGERLKDTVLSDAPPATYYSLHPSQRDSYYKPSFNVTIGSGYESATTNSNPRRHARTHQAQPVRQRQHSGRQGPVAPQQQRQHSSATESQSSLPRPLSTRAKPQPRPSSRSAGALTTKRSPRA
eukprot:m.61468 g.61468  ORF g.61468 m.61468 type:complete len:618 (-) comp11867_c0_seq2:24-1877(-)